MVRDESSKGSDVIGFRFNKNAASSKDVLTVFETKTQFSKGIGKSRIQDAINDSAKDHIRIDESLNYIKQKLYERNEIDRAKDVERFQSPVDLPYHESFGAVAIISEEHLKVEEITIADTRKVPKTAKSAELMSHPKSDQLVLLIIKGSDMMTLVNELYRRAADES